MLPYCCCCSQGREGTGRATAFLLTAVFLSAAVTISPGLAVPDASTTSLVLPGEEGLKGAGPEDDPALSQGFGGEPPPAIKGESTSSTSQLYQNRKEMEGPKENVRK